MNTGLFKKFRLVWRSLPALSKLLVVVLLIIATFMAALALTVAGSGILIAAGVLVLMAAFVATGIRWAPVLPAIFSGLGIFVFVTASPFPLYHLAHPKDAYEPWQLGFVIFIMITIIFWCMFVGLVGGIAATITNYVQRAPHTPGWFRPALYIMIGVLIGAITLGSFGPTPAPAATTSTNTNGVPTVHLKVGSFSASTINIAKGSNLLLIDDGAFEHIISNGTWVNDQPRAGNASGQPGVNNLTIKNADQQVEIGPFTTAGTYHLYCSLHTGMTLTVVVQ